MRNFTSISVDNKLQVTADISKCRRQELHQICYYWACERYKFWITLYLGQVLVTATKNTALCRSN